MAAKKKNEKVEIPALAEEFVEIPIRAIDGPLVVHNWSIKAIKELLEKHMHINLSSKKEAKDPEMQFKESLYMATDGTYGFPATGFKSAIVRAAKMIEGLDMITCRQLVFVLADCREDREFEVPIDPPFMYHVQNDLVRIDAKPEMRMDMVRLNGRSPDIRFRGEFKDWAATLKIRYMADMISPAQIANLVNRAGHMVGIGEGRPEKSTDMSWGKWEVATK